MEIVKILFVEVDKGTTYHANKHQDKMCISLDARNAALVLGVIIIVIWCHTSQIYCQKRNHREILTTDFEGGRHQNRVNKILYISQSPTKVGDFYLY